jgi:SAM-dependent methyltransferase
VAVKAGPQQVQRDFDALALLPEERWDHNVHYHDWLLRHLPDRLGRALEVGCGRGRFTRRLAERADHVVAVDISPGMILAASGRSRGHDSIHFVLADAGTWSFPYAEFDCVASIATIHHLSFEPALVSLRDALRPGGTLLVLDLYEPMSSADRVRQALAVPASALVRLARTGRPLPPSAVRRAWRRHGENDVYPRYDRIVRACAHGLPGARVRRHFFWRYSIVWRKPIR